MRAVVMFLAVVSLASPASSADGTWVAFKRSNELSTAFERASVTPGAASVNVLFVAPDRVYDGIVLSHKIRVESFKFNCTAKTFSILGRKLYSREGSLASDESAIAKAFAHIAHPVREDAQRTMMGLVCSNSEPTPNRPFPDLKSTISWMTQ